jgi:hypothetical protein
MSRTTAFTFASLLALAATFGCRPDSTEPVLRLEAMSFASSEWSEPVNVGAPINSQFVDAQPELSSDELSLYFVSNRPGGFGANDIWVSRRACLDCPWEQPVNLGTVINGSSGDGGPNLSNDGHVLFFGSGRPGGLGAQDIYMSRRVDPNDDLGWAPAVNLGPGVNTAEVEGSASYVQDRLYFDRGDFLVGGGDIYQTVVTRDGEIREPAVLVAELSIPNIIDQSPTLRADGREIIFHSFRDGFEIGSELWASTRRSVHDAWSPPANLGTRLNTAFLDQQPGLSHDGRTLLWASNRPGGLGGVDIWISTRTPSGH